MVKIQKSVLEYTREPSVIEDEMVTSLSEDEQRYFYDCLDEDVMLMSTYPEEPSDFNGEFETENFRVLHTIVGGIEGDIAYGFGRMTYNIVDIGIQGKKLFIQLNLGIDDADYWGINSYEVVEYTYGLIEEGHYLDYLMGIDEEDEII